MDQVGEQQTTSSVFGTGDPLRLKVNILSDDDNLNLGATSTDTGTESFQNTNSSSGTQNIVSLLNRYEARNNEFSSYYANPNIPKCSTVNLGDYVDNRVGQCNCIVD